MVKLNIIATNIAAMKTVPWFDDIPDWSYIDSDNKNYLQTYEMFLMRSIIILRNSSTAVHRSHRNDN